MVHYFNEKTPAGKLEVSSRASSNFRRFGRVRLSHRNIRLFGTVWWLLYGRRRWVWELAQVKWHGGRMPKSPSAITWFAAADQFLNLHARLKAASEVQELRIGGCLDLMWSRG